jgi:hypothetical protein
MLPATGGAVGSSFAYSPIFRLAQYSAQLGRTPASMIVATNMPLTAADTTLLGLFLSDCATSGVVCIISVGACLRGRGRWACIAGLPCPTPEAMLPGKPVTHKA